MNCKVFSAVCIFALIAICSARYDPSTAVGPCVGNRCPDGYSCYNNQCVLQRMRDSVKMPSQDGDINLKQAIGPCVNGYCPAGYQCMNNQCFKGKGQKRGVPIGPCVGTRCPEGYTCNVAELMCYA